jgi:hypothetical protein
MKKITALFIFVLFCFLNYGVSFAEELTLVYTGSTHSMLYPCNCPSEPDGGIARRATLIKELKGANPEMLLLDSGNFSASGLLDENTQNTELDMQRTIVNLKAMELMNYDALNIGEDEFNFGEGFFGENADKLKLNFISANLKAGKILPYIIKDLAGVKTGIIGLTNHKAKDKTKNIKIIESKTALKDSVAQLKAKGADMIILLSNLGGEEDAKLINEIKGIDVLIDSQALPSNSAEFKPGDTIVLRPAWQGRRLGKAVLSLKDKRITGYKTEEIRVSDKFPDALEILSILPRCFSDNDCKKPGSIGSCQDAGDRNARCLFKEAQKVQLTVLIPKDCVVCNTEPVVGFLKKQFAGLKVSYLYYPERNALNLIKKLDISALPVYILGKEVEKAEGFADLKPNLEAKRSFYLIKPEVGGLAYFFKRKEVRGKFDVFLSLFDKNTFELLKVIKELNPIIHFLVIKENGKFSALNGAPEVEEDLRAVCVQKYYPDIFFRYLSCRSRNINSSWWDDCLEGSDIDRVKVCARGEEGALLLEANSKINSEIKVMFGPTYLLDNKVIFSSKGVPAKEDLEKIIKK